MMSSSHEDGIMACLKILGWSTEGLLKIVLIKTSQKVRSNIISEIYTDTCTQNIIMRLWWLNKVPLSVWSCQVFFMSYEVFNERQGKLLRRVSRETKQWRIQSWGEVGAQQGDLKSQRGASRGRVWEGVWGTSPKKISKKRTLNGDFWKHLHEWN